MGDSLELDRVEAFHEGKTLFTVKESGVRELASSISSYNEQQLVSYQRAGMRTAKCSSEAAFTVPLLQHPFLSRVIPCSSRVFLQDLEPFDTDSH